MEEGRRLDLPLRSMTDSKIKLSKSAESVSATCATEG